MAKITLNDLGGLGNETTALNTINGNSTAIETWSDSVLSRDGTEPNFMQANLDMNGFSIVNCPTIDDDATIVKAAQLSLAGDLSASIGTTTIPFDTTDIDTDTIFSALDTGFVYTINGIWHVDLGCMVVNGGLAADVEVALYVNGSPVRSSFATIAANKTATLTVSCILSALSGDIVTAQIVTTQDVTVDNASTWFGTHYIGLAS